MINVVSKEATIKRRFRDTEINNQQMKAPPEEQQATTAKRQIESEDNKESEESNKINLGEDTEYSLKLCRYFQSEASIYQNPKLIRKGELGVVDGDINKSLTRAAELHAIIRKQEKELTWIKQLEVGTWSAKGI